MRLLLLLIACSGAPAPVENVGHVTATLVGESELVGAGFTATTATDGKLLCRGERCICVMPLDCGDCATRASDLEKVRAERSEGRGCDAEVGHMCGLTYLVGGFMYDSDIRYYAGDRLVGQLHSTDYPAYCDKQTREILRGRVPDCAEPVRDAQSLCKPPQRVGEVMNPKDALLLP